jgi:hypothetical protein
MSTSYFCNLVQMQLAAICQPYHAIATQQLDLHYSVTLVAQSPPLGFRATNAGMEMRTTLALPVHEAQHWRSPLPVLVRRLRLAGAVSAPCLQVAGTSSSLCHP